MYGDRFNFTPSHKVLLTTNHKPRITGTDLAIWRRVKVIPFDYIVPESEVDPDLRRRLVAEHGGAVLAWLVEGAVAWHKDGLGEAEAVTTATEDYRPGEDLFGAWLDERTVAVDHKVRVKVGDLWKSWKTWCEQTGEKTGRQQDFTAAGEEHGHKVAEIPRRSPDQGNRPLVTPREASSGNFSISTSTGTLRTRPHEASPEPLF